MIVDCHAHAWSADAPLDPDRGYTPPAAPSVDDYLALLDRHGVSHGVLVQPSFLGTDNGYILAALKAHPDRLRGVVVVDPDCPRSTLSAFAKAGIVGLRLNLISAKTMPDYGSPACRRLCEWAAAQGWHVELHAEGAMWCDVLPPLLATGAELVIDHFGRPDPALGTDCPGFHTVLDAAESGRVWIKFSGAYRLGGRDARDYAPAYLRAAGPERIVWGSDFPWTRFEAGRSYRACVDELAEWVSDVAVRRTILGENAARLFRFGCPAV